MVHTEKDVHGAPHSDRKAAQTGSSYQCSVSIYITTVQGSSQTSGAKVPLKKERFRSVSLALMTSNYLTNDSQSVLADILYPLLKSSHDTKQFLKNNLKTIYIFICVLFQWLSHCGLLIVAE